MHMTKKQFESGIISQDDDNDYSESGWVCFEFDGQYHLARYSHCSCYGTFEALSGGGISDYYESGEISVDWSGSKRDLLKMAKKKLDPAMSERVASPEDYDYDHLCNMYAGVLSHFETHKEIQKFAVPIILDDGSRHKMYVSVVNLDETEIVEGEIGAGKCLRFEFRDIVGTMSGRSAHQLGKQISRDSEFWVK